MILFIVDWIVDASNRDAVINACLVDASGETVLWHGHFSCENHRLGCAVVLDTGVSKKVPYILRSRRTRFYKTN